MNVQIDAVVVIGTSAGGVSALKEVLSNLPASFPAPIVVVCHSSANNYNNPLPSILNSCCQLEVKEAQEREKIEAGFVYIAPASYHLLLEKDLTLSLSIDKKVMFCRPSIDVLFESASDALAKKILAVILTGANSDGARGSLRVKENGGRILLQNPDSAYASTMPNAVMRMLSKNDYKVDYKESLNNLGARLLSMIKASKALKN